MHTANYKTEPSLAQHTGDAPSHASSTAHFPPGSLQQAESSHSLKLSCLHPETIAQRLHLPHHMFLVPKARAQQVGKRHLFSPGFSTLH